MESFFLTHTHAQAKPYIFVHTDTPSKGLWNRRTVTREKPQQGCHYSGPFRDARGELPLKLAEQGSQPSSLLTKSQGGLLAISLLQFLPFFLLGSGLQGGQTMPTTGAFSFPEPPRNHMLPTQSLSSRLQTPKRLPGAWVPGGRKTPLSFPQGSSQVRYIGELLILIKGTPQLCVPLLFISPMSFLKFRVPSSCYPGIRDSLPSGLHYRLLTNSMA